VARYFSTEICGNSSISDLGPISLIIFSIGCLTIAIFLSRGLTPKNSLTAENQNEVIGGTSLEAFKNIIGKIPVRLMAFYMLLWTALSTAAWMISLDIVESWSSDPCERTAFFAQIEQIVTPLTLLMQIFFTSFLLRTVGILPILTIYGAFFFIAFGAYANYPEITTVLVLTIVIRVFEYGLNKPTRETVFTSLKQQDRYKSTVMMDTLLARSGDVAGSWFIRSLIALGLVGGSIAYAALPIAVLLSIVGYQAAKSFKV
jgi:AAA family ATP:ADP antiporter